MPIELGSFSLGAIAGGIVIGIANHYLSKSRNKEEREITEFNKAAAIFRDVFLPETTYLKHHANIGGLGNSNRFHEMLRTAYLRQLKALEIFKDYLSVADRESIYCAWDEYCHPKGVPTDENEKRDFRFNDYMSIEEREGTDKAKEVALQKIEEILRFAKHK